MWEITDSKVDAYLKSGADEMSRALDLVFYHYELGRDVTIREYFLSLLSKLWEEEEEFNSKRPFGNSGWKDSLAHVLIENGYLRGEIDGDGFPDYEQDDLDIFGLELIHAMGK
ncbi:MAG: hypothetical protein KJO08_10075 [Gammaproteobacteria bacterium]|nr:hypothetical protein [Gammaproteobacteria bacterium]NNJ84545.1 hypothetical protein [Gammaproteobacteria bacterium]